MAHLALGSPTFFRKHGTSPRCFHGAGAFASWSWSNHQIRCARGILRPPLHIQRVAVSEAADAKTNVLPYLSGVSRRSHEIHPFAPCFDRNNIGTVERTETSCRRHTCIRVWLDPCNLAVPGKPYLPFRSSQVRGCGSSGLGHELGRSACQNSLASTIREWPDLYRGKFTCARICRIHAGAQNPRLGSFLLSSLLCNQIPYTSSGFDTCGDRGQHQ